MNIDEAIDLLTQTIGPNSMILDNPLGTAIKLGIEALETERYNRAHPANPRKGLLPGETK